MYLEQFDRQKVSTFRQWVSEARHIVLLSHTNADGDACGSILGMTLQLDRAATAAVSVVPILPNGCPKTFSWMPSSHRILSGEADRQLCERTIAEADLLVCVDFNAASRIDFLADALLYASGRKVLIDHHINPATDQFDIIFSREISSACELALWTSMAMWERQYLNQEVATCFYTGLSTDTGGFAYSCEDPSCFEAAAILVSYNIHAADIHNHIVNTFSINRMQFYGFAINERLYIYPEHKTAMFYFSLEDQRRFHVGGEDMEGLVNYTLMMAEIEVGVLLREEPTRTKVSFRSKYDVNVNELAKQIGGGGHLKASGATVEKPLAETLEMVKGLLGISGEKHYNFVEA